MCKLNVLITIAVPVVDERMHRFKFVPKNYNLWSSQCVVANRKDFCFEARSMVSMDLRSWTFKEKQLLFQGVSRP